MTRFWIDFETLHVLGDFPFSTFFGEVHARIIPNFGFHGKGVESLGTFLLLYSLCNLISLFFQSSGAKRSITAEKLQKIIAMTGFLFFFSFLTFSLGPGRQPLGITWAKGGFSSNIVPNPTRNSF